MTHEKIIKDERGTIRIKVKFWCDEWGRKDINGNSFAYEAHVFHTAPRKRTEVINTGIATDSEVLAAKLEFWNKIKPV